MPVDPTTVSTWYNAILQRDPSAGELASGQNLTEGELVEVLLNGADADVDQVVRLYQGVFNRLPDADGLEYWVGRLREIREETAGYDANNPDDVKKSLAVAMEDWFDPGKTPEMAALVDTTDDQALLNLLYANFFDREPDSEGNAYWLGRLADGMTIQEIVVHFSESEEYRNLTSGDVDAFLISLLEDPDQYIDDQPELDTASGITGGGEEITFDEEARLKDENPDDDPTIGRNLYVVESGPGPDSPDYNPPDSRSIDGGEHRDTFRVVKKDNNESQNQPGRGDDGMSTVDGFGGKNIEVVEIRNEDEEDTEFRDGHVATDFLGDRDFGYSALFYEDNGYFLGEGDPNGDTVGTSSMLAELRYLGNLAEVELEANGTTEEEDGVFYNYYNADSCLPELPLTKQLPFIPYYYDDLARNQVIETYFNPDWLEVSLEGFKDIEEVFVTNSANGVLITDVQQNFWDTFATLTLDDIKVDMVLFDSDRQANTGTDLVVNVNEASLSHLVLTENHEEEANSGDQIPTIHIVGGDIASVIGNIQNGVMDPLFLSGEVGPDYDPGLDNSGYSSATTKITATVRETSDTGRIIDGQGAQIHIPHAALCRDPGFDEQFDLYLGTVVGLGDRLPGLEEFDAHDSTGDILAVFAIDGLEVTGGYGEDYFIWDELGETGSNFNFTGTSVDGGGGFDQIGLFSDDLSNLENSGPVTNVEALVALEPIGFGVDSVANPFGNPDDPSPYDDPDLGDDQEGSLFETNILNDGPGSADALSPAGSNDPFSVNLSNFDESLQYMYFASGVDSDIEVIGHAANDFTIEFNQVNWSTRYRHNDEDREFSSIPPIEASSGIDPRDAGGLPGSYYAAALEEGAANQNETVFEGFDIHIGSDRVEGEQRVNLHFNVKDIDLGLQELDQVWNGINEEDIDGVPNHVQSIVDGEENAGTLNEMSRVDVLGIHASTVDCDGDAYGGGTDLFVDNLVTKALHTLYLSDDGQNNGGMRVETGSRGRELGSGALLSLVDGSRSYAFDGENIIAQDVADVACEGDAYDQLLTRLEECDCLCEDWPGDLHCDWGYTQYKKGNDWLSVSDDGAVFLMGEGNDTAAGGAGDDIMFGNGGSDILLGEGGDDYINGNNADGTDDLTFDQIQGGGGADTLILGADDVGFGDAGDDSIIGNAGDQTAYGGGGDDFIALLGGNDRIAGGDGDDILLGGTGNDVVVGEGGDDLVDADTGTDVLVGDGYVPGTCDCPCYEIKVSGHIGDDDRFIVWVDGERIEYASSLGQSPGEVADGLAALLSAHLGGDFVVEADGTTIRIEPCTIWVDMPDFSVAAEDNPITPDAANNDNGVGIAAGDGVGIDFGGSADKGNVDLGGQTFNPGDVINIYQDEILIGSVVVPAADDAECPCDNENLDQILTALLGATNPDNGFTAQIIGSKIVFTGPDSSTDSTFTAEVVDVEAKGNYVLDIDHGDVNDTLLFSAEVTDEAGNSLGTINIVAPGADTSAVGTVEGYTKVAGDNDADYAIGLVDAIDAALAELGLPALANAGPAASHGGFDPVSAGAFYIQTSGYKFDIAVGDTWDADEGGTLDADNMVVLAVCETDDNDVAVNNGSPILPLDDDTQALSGEYCLDPAGSDLFVAQAVAGRTAGDFADGFDNDYIPVDYGYNHDNTLLKGFVGDEPADNHDSDTAVDCWIEDWLEVSTMGSGNYDISGGDGADTGVRGVTYVVDFNGIGADTVAQNGVLADQPLDKLAFRTVAGDFDANGTAINYSEEHNNASTRDDADANAFNAFSSNDNLRYYAVSNDGNDGGDMYLRVYYNEAGTDAAPDAVMELAGYTNVQTQFHYLDISDAGYTVADYADDGTFYL